MDRLTAFLKWADEHHEMRLVNLDYDGTPGLLVDGEFTSASVEEIVAAFSVFNRDDCGDDVATGDDWTQLRDAAELERKRRVYYQDIVYAVCVAIDKICERPPTKGMSLACGTAENPTTAVKDAMTGIVAMIERLKLERGDH